MPYCIHTYGNTSVYNPEVCGDKVYRYNLCLEHYLESVKRTSVNLISTSLDRWWSNGLPCY